MEKNKMNKNFTVMPKLKYTPSFLELFLSQHGCEFLKKKSTITEVLKKKNLSNLTFSQNSVKNKNQ